MNELLLPNFSHLFLSVDLFLQYLRDYPTFAATARYWTEAFAKSASTGMEEKVLTMLAHYFIVCVKPVHVDEPFCLRGVQVQKLVEMGFPEDLVRSTLKSVDGDENLALEKLCSG
jgi:ubiquitin-conjugating enzyme (huntingtin interacting protein 2)